MIYKEKNSGITLVALVVTIIVLLLLAGISLSMLTGSNGLLSKATKAGEDSIIGEEKERVVMAYNGALTEKYKTDINAVVNSEDIQAELDRNKTEAGAEANGTGTIEILFWETNHKYYIDVQGNITGPTIEEREDVENIFEYTLDGWIKGVKNEYLENWSEEIKPSMRNNVLIASLDWPEMNVAASGSNESRCFLVEELNGTLKIPNWIENTRIIGIDYYAFYGIDNLEKVEIANGVKEIRKGAFESCRSLKEVDFAKSIIYMGGSAFSGCSELASIEIPNGVKTIEKETFSYCRNLKNVKISSGVTSIGESAFNKCKKLENIEIPGNVKKIDLWAFSNCSGLKSVTIRNGVEWAAGYTFQDCENLTSVTIPGSLAEITLKMFFGCKNLENVIIQDGVNEIGSNAFDGCESLTNIEIPSTVTKIGRGAFSGCKGLTSIEIPNNVTTIGGYAFFNCSGLTSIEIPNNVTTIGGDAFLNCSGLTSIEIPSNVTRVEGYAFRGCTGLTKAYIPASLEYLGGYVFWGCSPSLNLYCEGSSTQVFELNGHWNMYGITKGSTAEWLHAEYNCSLEQYRNAT